MSQGSEPPSYHDLHITTAAIPRTSIFDLPYGVEVTCTRVTGWTVRQTLTDDGMNVRREPLRLGGEYDDPDAWLVLDVGGHVIVDSRRPPDGDDTD